MVQPLGQGQFPMEGMMGPSSPLGVVSAKTTMQEPDYFEALLNQLRGAGTKATGLVDANRGLLGKAARYGPGAGRTVSELGEGDYLGVCWFCRRYACCWGRRMKALAAVQFRLLVFPACLLRVVCTQAGSLIGSDVGAKPRWWCW
jgi:hypothetical protein